MTCTCRKCRGIGTIRVEERMLSTASSNAGTVVNYHEYSCPECKGKGYVESTWTTIPYNPKFTVAGR